FLPLIPLALVEKAPLERGEKLLRGADIVEVVSLALTGQCNPCAMVKIVVPQGVETIPAGTDRTHKLGMLLLILGDDKRRSRPSRSAHSGGDFAEDMRRRIIVDILRRVETQTVDM